MTFVSGAKNALVSEGTMNSETHSTSEENVKVIQGYVAFGTLYVRSMCQNNRKPP